MLPFARALHRAGNGTARDGTVGDGTVGSGTVGSGTVGSGTVGSGTVGSGTGGPAGLAVWVLRYRYRGWNEPDQDPVRDARWALDQARQRHPGAPVALLGHSMGARAALLVAGDPAVTAVCALAPWITPDEPVGQLRDRAVLIAHGDRERMTSPRLSFDYALAARGVSDRVCRFDVLGDGHAMLRRAGDWSWLVCRFVLGELGMQPRHPAITKAMLAPSPEGLRTPLIVADHG
jgi:pimeloyl-ACP methyl ester carboxylesterase